MQIEKELMRGAEPLAVLQILAGGECHGYEIIAGLAEHMPGAPGALARGQATLYPLLYSLESRGLIASRFDESSARPRQCYWLTDKGCRTLAAKVQIKATPEPPAPATPSRYSSLDDPYVEDPLALSSLPVPVQKLITEVVQRTRLWKRERLDITRQLFGHFQDGLAAGRTAEDLISTFGDVQLIARLMRRGKHRNRPMWWHMLQHTKRAIGVCVLLYVAAALVLALRKPNIKVDYIAELNRPIEAIPESDRAWPIYRKAWVEGEIWNLHYYDLTTLPIPPQARVRMEFGVVDWTRVPAFLEKHQVLLRAAREGGLKPALGLKLGFEEDYKDEDYAALYATGAILPRRNQPPIPVGNPNGLAHLDRALGSVELPLTSLKSMARLLMLDLLQAAEIGDAQRIVANYQALLGMARQNHVAAMDMVVGADMALARLVLTKPHILVPHRVALVQAMAGAKDVFQPDFTGNYKIVEDLIQRIFSDDGHGDGTITLEGMDVLSELQSVNLGNGPFLRADNEHSKLVKMATLPVTVFVYESRKAMKEKLDLSISLLEQDTRKPYWERIRNGSAFAAQMREWDLSYFAKFKTSPIRLLSFLGSVVDQHCYARARHEAVMVALQLEAYKDQHGQYPASLDQLVPEYLPAVPMDYSTGGPLRYKLKDGKPLLYGLGKDGKDDGGEILEKARKVSEPWDESDWILYPPMYPD